MKGLFLADNREVEILFQDALNNASRRAGQIEKKRKSINHPPAKRQKQSQATCGDEGVRTWE